MNYYHIWCNLKDSHKDLEFSKALDAYLGHLKSIGVLEKWTLSRRKFGFGPQNLGEFHIVIEMKDLAQLDAAFGVVAKRTGETEARHHDIYTIVADFQSALYRDFPDPERGQP